MRLSKIPAVSYFGTSVNINTSIVYTCAPDLLADDRKSFWGEFIQLLKKASVKGHKWIVSFQGCFAIDSLLPIVIAVSDPKFECVYWLADVYKPHPDSISNFTELSLLCEMDIYENIIREASIEMRYNFYIGGWLVPDGVSAEMVVTRKFKDGKFAIHGASVKGSFFSSDDFNHIVIVPCDPSFERALSRCGPQNSV